MEMTRKVHIHADSVKTSSSKIQNLNNSVKSIYIGSYHLFVVSLAGAVGQALSAFKEVK